jgi:hypothetical protein
MDWIRQLDLHVVRYQQVDAVVVGSDVQARPWADADAVPTRELELTKRCAGHTPPLEVLYTINCVLYLPHHCEGHDDGDVGGH